MTADQLVQYLTWLLYLLIFALVAREFVRQRTPAHLDMAVFFADTAAIIILGTIFNSVAVVPPPWLSDLSGGLLMALPYLLLRLVVDFSYVPAWLIRASELGLGLSVVAIVVLPTPMPWAPALVLVAYFVALTGYDTWAFVRQAGRSSGVTRRRMQAIAVGAICLGLVLVLAGLSIAVPATAGVSMALSQATGLASGLAFFIGFAPPSWLRKAWQDPEVRAFLTHAATLPHLPDTRRIVRELESGAAASLGAPAAAIGLWDDQRQRLRFTKDAPHAGHVPASSSFRLEDGVWELELSAKPVSATAFREQRALLVADVEREDPSNGELYRRYDARAALATPITAGERRLGVLVVYAPRAPVFADSDLELLRLLADQAAVILESRALIDRAARIQAREETTRLKEDFLSSAAHDLKTPLTGMLTQTQMLQRHSQRNPSAPPDPISLDRLLREARRLKRLVVELLDAAQLEETVAPPDSEAVIDLAELAREVCATSPRCVLEARRPVLVYADTARTRQILEHLVDNALNYDPSGGDIQVRTWVADNQARVAVIDRGIGIQPEDLPHVFERFYRGRNVDDRRFAGLGLGLYISRRNVEQLGGRIWVESTAGAGTTFFVELPIAAEATGDARPALQERML